MLPLVLGLIQVFGTTTAAHRHGEQLGLLAYVLLIAGPAALLVRRRWRPVALVVAVGATAAYYALGYPNGPGFLAAVVAILGAVRTGHRVLTWIVVAAAYLTWGFVAMPAAGLLVSVAVWLVVILVVGEAIRARTAHFAELMRARAERERALQEQERARVEHRRRQASEERLRIARELHDVLGHHLSLINVQAGVGLHLMDEKPEQARAALTAIKQASAEALREVRNVLSALRPEDESAPRAPAPGLAGADPPERAAGLHDLVADVTAAGLPVSLAVSGTPRALPAEVDRAAYRIVQEALTNVRRHAGSGAVATVRVAYCPGDVVVYVADDGPGGDGPPDGGSGTGVEGMRQRVEALGGEFRAGPAPDQGFEVYARLPLGGCP
jgi:signal transduction histidine kinase